VSLKPTDDELRMMGEAYQLGVIEYPKEAQEAEDQYVYNHIEEIIGMCKKNNRTLEQEIGVYRGTWEIEYGFCRSEEVINNLKNKEIENIKSELLSYFKGDEEKVKLWLKTPNMNFGDCSPMTLIHLNRGHKVMSFIKAAKEGY